MKTAPVRPAAIEFVGGTPRSTLYGDVYHPRAGALAQARHVFLAGNGLPERWRGRRRFTILEAGFGLGNNFLAAWDAWRGDAARCERLHYIGIELHPPTLDDLRRAHAGSPLSAQAEALIAQWPLATPNLHGLSFDDGRVRLLLGWFDVRDALPEIVAEVDAFFLDGFAPAKNPAMWQRHVCKALGRIAAPGASAATWSVARAVQDGLHEAGFAVEKARGFGDKREMTVARFAPRFTPRRPVGRAIAVQAPPRVAIVGGGLAGCALAWALSRQGIASRVFERRAWPAEETSGNAGGVFHGIVTPHDGPHARFNRAAALAATPLVECALREHAVAGSTQGLLRLDAASDAGAMRSTLDALGLPGGYVQALDSGPASERAGLPLGGRTAWFYPGGGFVDPRGLAGALLALAGDATIWRGASAVAALRRAGDGWRLLDARGATLDIAEAVALCGNADALALRPDASARWPLQRLRGQTTGVPASALGGFVPRLPIAGFGYVLPPIDGTVWCGATRDADDAAPELRASDHARNLEQLARLVGRGVGELPLDALQGRVGWRLVADDRLPLIGAAPDVRVVLAGQRLDQPRFVPREAGLFVFTALASRGLTWAVLGARTLAARIAGAPCPIEASLLDAVDVGRFAARAARRG